MLILAAVSIATLTGENGILTQSQTAKEKTTIGEEKEVISLAYTSCKAKDYENIVTDTQLQEELEKNQKNVQVSISEDDLIVWFRDTEHRYTIKQDGTIEQIEDLNPEEANKIVDMLDRNIGVTAGGKVVYIDEELVDDQLKILNTDDRIIITKNGIRKVEKNYFIDGMGKVYAWGNCFNGELKDETREYVEVPLCLSEMDNDLKDVKIIDIYSKGGTEIALDDKGRVYTWGSNFNGQLGDGTTGVGLVFRDTPLCISNQGELNGVVIEEIYFDGDTVIAKDTQGKLYTWGYNVRGELGDGTTEVGSDGYRNVPLCISNEGELKGVQIEEIYFNGHTVIAKDTQGKIYTWGSNSSGQLGDGTTGVGQWDYRNTPLCISNKGELKEVKIEDIFMFSDTVIARGTRGEIYTWGDNYYGQLGDGTTEVGYDKYRNTPKCISNDGELKGVVIEDIYYNGTIIAKDAQGKIYTWGNNMRGELGDGTTDEERNTPKCISNEGELKGVQIEEIYFNGDTVIAKDTQGKLYTWGYNVRGELGDGTTDEERNTPKCISNEGELKGVQIEDVYLWGTYHNSIIAKDSQGKIYTWGNNENGELGDGTTENKNIPICLTDDKNNKLYNQNIKNIYYLDHYGEQYVAYITNKGEIIYYHYSKLM